MLRMFSVTVHVLIVPRVRRSTFGARSFAIAGPTVWGILCLTVCVIQLLGLISFDVTWKRTHLFQWHCVSFSALAVFSRNALYKSTFYFLTYLLLIKLFVNSRELSWLDRRKIVPYLLQCEIVLVVGWRFQNSFVRRFPDRISPFPSNLRVIRWLLFLFNHLLTVLVLSCTIISRPPRGVSR